MPRGGEWNKLGKKIYRSTDAAKRNAIGGERQITCKHAEDVDGGRIRKSAQLLEKGVGGIFSKNLDQNTHGRVTAGVGEHTTHPWKGTARKRPQT